MSFNSLKLSLVIPVYNEENHLKNCLDAIALQTVKPHEVIVVDNNSVDKTAEIAGSYDFVRLVQEKKQGIVHARNRGFNAARGQIIGRIDADTILPEDWVETVQRHYEAATKDFALAGSVYFYNVRFPRFSAWLVGKLSYRASRVLFGFYFLQGCNMAMTRSMWQAVCTHTCSRTDVHEDLDLSIHLRDQGYKIRYTEAINAGILLRRAQRQPKQFWGWISMWPRTMRIHGFALWPLVTAGNILIFTVYRPFILISGAISKVAERRLAYDPRIDSF